MVAVTSNWQTAEDREAGGPSFAPLLQRAAEFGLNPIRIDLYEQVVLELLQPALTESRPDPRRLCRRSSPLTARPDSSMLRLWEVIRVG